MQENGKAGLEIPHAQYTLHCHVWVPLLQLLLPFLLLFSLSLSDPIVFC